jgi:hypothetical protein
MADTHCGAHSEDLTTTIEKRFDFAPVWCNVVQSGYSMALKPKKRQDPPKNTIRATVSFPADYYARLERIAIGKKVSVAWVVREAIEKYLDEPGPLFKG